MLSYVLLSLCNESTLKYSLIFLPFASGLVDFGVAVKKHIKHLKFMQSPRLHENSFSNFRYLASFIRPNNEMYCILSDQTNIFFIKKIYSFQELRLSNSHTCQGSGYIMKSLYFVSLFPRLTSTVQNLWIFNTSPRFLQMWIILKLVMTLENMLNNQCPKWLFNSAHIFCNKMRTRTARTLI